MSQLRRLVLIRHGETVGESSVRFHGSNDVELSAEGRALMREVGRGLRGEVFDLVLASPLRRSWEEFVLPHIDPFDRDHYETVWAAVARRGPAGPAYK